MSKSWKRHERVAADIISGRRFWSNSGEKLDGESADYVCQSKEVKNLSHAQLTALALEVERQGSQCDPPKLGVVITKRRAGHGNATPVLVTMTESVFRELRDRARKRPDA